MPNNDALKLKVLAQRLLAHEAGNARHAGAKGPQAFHVCEMLRGPLVKLVGIGGFRSLMSRALALAGVETPWMRALHIKADGSFEGLDNLAAKLDSPAVLEGQLVVTAQILGLLVTFIGTDLTLWLLRDIWPKMDDLNL
jgi:hypothetical protein